MTQISAHGVNRFLHRENGFTLVEILVVLLVIGIALAVVTANIAPGDKQAAETEASRLADLLEQAAQDASNSGETLAWSGKDDVYRFWRKQNGDWIEITDDDLYRTRTLQNGVLIGGEWVDKSSVGPDQKLVFNPSGVNRPFEIVLTRNGVNVKISSDVMNRVTVESDVSAKQ